MKYFYPLMISYFPLMPIILAEGRWGLVNRDSTIRSALEEISLHVVETSRYNNDVYDETEKFCEELISFFYIILNGCDVYKERRSVYECIVRNITQVYSG